MVRTNPLHSVQNLNFCPFPPLPPPPSNPSIAVMVEFRCSLSFCNAMYDNPTHESLWVQPMVDTQGIVLLVAVGSLVPTSPPQLS